MCLDFNIDSTELILFAFYESILR